MFLSKATRTSCTDLYAMRLNGRNVRRVTFTSACESDPSYSADGRRLVFEAHTDYADHVVIATLGPRGILRTTVVDGHSPDWSPDGRFVAYVSGTRVIVVNTDGRVQREVELSSRDHSQITAVAWSPRGDRLLVAQTYAPPGCSIGVCRSGTPIYSVAMDGSDRREITYPGIDHDGEPAWQPLPRRTTP